MDFTAGLSKTIGKPRFDVISTTQFLDARTRKAFNAGCPFSGLEVAVIPESRSFSNQISSIIDFDQLLAEIAPVKNTQKCCRHIFKAKNYILSCLEKTSIVPFKYASKGFAPAMPIVENQKPCHAGPRDQ